MSEFTPPLTEESLVIEARVKPKDIAFLRPGQDALVKLSSSDQRAIRHHTD